MDGLMVAGEAAGLILNNGKAIRGMDFALQSGILAAETALAARAANDFAGASLAAYRAALEKGVLAEIKAGQAAVHLLHGPQMFEAVPGIACDFGREFFSVTDAPPRKTAAILSGAVKKHSSFASMAKLGWKAWRGL
jgi:electron transfer flavoprotein-quinone oxidoreductase